MRAWRLVSLSAIGGAALVVACTLNPQPLPPLSESADDAGSKAPPQSDQRPSADASSSTGGMTREGGAPVDAPIDAALGADGSSDAAPSDGGLIDAPADAPDAG